MSWIKVYSLASERSVLVISAKIGKNQFRYLKYWGHCSTSPPPTPGVKPKLVLLRDVKVLLPVDKISGNNYPPGNLSHCDQKKKGSSLAFQIFEMVHPGITLTFQAFNSGICLSDSSLAFWTLGFAVEWRYSHFSFWLNYFSNSFFKQDFESYGIRREINLSVRYPLWESGFGYGKCIIEEVKGWNWTSIDYYVSYAVSEIYPLKQIVRGILPVNK